MNGAYCWHRCVDKVNREGQGLQLARRIVLCCCFVCLRLCMCVCVCARLCMQMHAFMYTWVSERFKFSCFAVLCLLRNIFTAASRYIIAPELSVTEVSLQSRKNSAITESVWSEAELARSTPIASLSRQHMAQSFVLFQSLEGKHFFSFLSLPQEITMTNITAFFMKKKCIQCLRHVSSQQCQQNKTKTKLVQFLLLRKKN